jgi:hypothetical protein
VLQPEKREQRRVDDHRSDREGAATYAAAIDALTYDMHVADREVGVGDKSDQVKKGDQENYIRSDAIGRSQDAPG